jgi:hypothetical protein
MILCACPECLLRGWRTIFVICTSCSDMPAVGFMLAIMPLGLFGKAIALCRAGSRGTLYASDES